MKTKTDKIEPLSREFLLNRGYCCGNGCFNCPYKKKKMKRNKHPYYDSDRKRQTEEHALQAIGICMFGLFLIYMVSLVASVIL